MASSCSMLPTERSSASLATRMPFAMERTYLHLDLASSGVVLSQNRYWNASTRRPVSEEIWIPRQESAQMATQVSCVALARRVTTSRLGSRVLAVDLGTAR